MTVSPATVHRYVKAAGRVTAEPKKKPKSSYIRFEGRSAHRSLNNRTPAAAYYSRPKAGPIGRDDPHWRVRHDRIDVGGKITLRHQGRMFKIGIGRHLARTRVICLVKDLDIRIIDVATGEILRALTLDTTRTYQPTGRPQGSPKGPRKPKHPNP